MIVDSVAIVSTNENVSDTMETWKMSIASCVQYENPPRSNEILERMKPALVRELKKFFPMNI